MIDLNMFFNMNVNFFSYPKYWANETLMNLNL